MPTFGKLSGPKVQFSIRLYGQHSFLVTAIVFCIFIKENVMLHRPRTTTAETVLAQTVASLQSPSYSGYSYL